ncbi:MAG: hypothetical protein A2562_04225 [Candidatus Nealsonbacteria bacterium RIFOXYD1_FULL_39_11]|nr:MAG: hypothetical protein A2562_04225 [Candidatus Nealsonbacteria bacterium RIFOXYD1_FULL_39_11]
MLGKNEALLSGGGSLPNKPWAFDGFNLGDNTYALATELRGNELAVMLNAELYGKRSIRPRRGGEKLGGTLGGDRVDGLFQFKEDATNEILAISGGDLKKYNSSTEAWDNVSASAFTSGLRTRAVKMKSALYFGNGTDDFTKYDGATVATFTAVAAPAGLAVAPQGTPGTSSYEYTVTTVTAKGQSLAATNVAITNGAETLDTTDFNRITFTRRTEAQVIGYNLFGRSTLGNGVTLMKFIPQPTSGATVTFDDDGSITPTIWLPPDGDSTDGIKAAIWEQLRGSLIGGKDPASRDRMYYSGTGDKYESFSPAHNGGWVDVRPGDNDNGINAFAPFESKIIIGKEKSIHQFYFSTTTGDAIIQELITYVGCGAPGSMVVMENDIAFLDAERKLRILGYEPNYTSAIRTTTLSEGRVQSLFDEINNSYMENVEAVYHQGRYILSATSASATQNDFILAYDRRYLAFLGKWTGEDCHVRSWLVWDGLDKRQKLYAAGSDSPYVFEFSVEGKLTNHDGSAIVTVIRTRNEDQGNSGQEKIFKWADFRLYRIVGTLKIKTIIDGDTTIDERSFSSTSSTGWGRVPWGTTMWGVSTGEAADASNLDRTYRKEIYETGNSLQFEITKEGAQDDFILVSIRGESLLLPTEVFDTANII